MTLNNISVTKSACRFMASLLKMKLIQYHRKLDSPWTRDTLSKCKVPYHAAMFSLPDLLHSCNNLVSLAIDLGGNISVGEVVYLAVLCATVGARGGAWGWI